MINSNSILQRTFAEKEAAMYDGLILFLSYSLSEYLTEQQMTSIADYLRMVRSRSADQNIADLHIRPVTDSREIRNIHLPAKQLHRDELAYVIYLLSPYAVMSRKETAVFAKLIFPEFFPSVSTINTLFTKLEGVPEGQMNIKVQDVPKRNVLGVEEMLLNLVSPSV